MKLGIRRCLAISSLVLICVLAVCCFSLTPYRPDDPLDLDRRPADNAADLDRKPAGDDVYLDTRLSVADYERAMATVRARGVDLDQERYSHLRMALRFAQSEGGVRVNMLERIAVQFQDTGLTCDARFRTYRDGQLVDGAVVRYRLITDEGGTSSRVDGLTSNDAQKTLDIGFYHVWAQRADRATSPTTDVFDIFEEETMIDLVEDK